jgi:hypothetical protein
MFKINLNTTTPNNQTSRLQTSLNKPNQNTLKTKLTQLLQPRTTNHAPQQKPQQTTKQPQN